MDLPWRDERSRQFVTNVGLVTTDGPHGPNIMAAEWTHHVSYSPGLVAVCVRSHEATYTNIQASREFGVSLAAADQNILSSVAGGYSGKDVDKIEALKELGFEFYPAHEIRAVLVKDAVANIECRLVQAIPMGSHMMFVGEVVEASAYPVKEPLIYHGGRYFKLGDHVGKPAAEELETIRDTVHRHSKRAA